MGSNFKVDIKDSKFTGIRSFTKGGVIYAGSEPNQVLLIPITEKPAAPSISEFIITNSIFYDFIDLAAIKIIIKYGWAHNCCNCMKNYERYGYLFYVDQKSAIVFSITNTIIDNFSNKSVDLDAKLSLNKYVMYPDDFGCVTFESTALGSDNDPFTLFDNAKGGSIIYLRSTNATISVTSRKNYYRGADLTSKGGVYYVSMTMKAGYGIINQGGEFIEEESIYEGNQGIYGGAIYIYVENVLENIRIKNSRFSNNRAVQGGAIMSVQRGK
jgi:hypothetical protein